MQPAQAGEGGEEGFLRRCEGESILRNGVLLALEGEEGRRVAGEGEEDLVEHSIISDSLVIMVPDVSPRAIIQFAKMRDILERQVIVHIRRVTLPE